MVIKVMKEKPQVYGNVLWQDFSESDKAQFIYYMKVAFGFVSPFPEGDGLMFSLGDIPRQLTNFEEASINDNILRIITELKFKEIMVLSNLRPLHISAALN
jgi:hypothetical protein